MENAEAEGRVSVSGARLLEELLRAQQDKREKRPPGALRTQELRDALGWTLKVVRMVLRELKGQGLIECIKIPWVGLDSVDGFPTQTVPAYRLLDEVDPERFAELVSKARLETLQEGESAE